MTALAPRLRALLAAGEPAVLVTVSQALGSTPREAGARMLVTRGEAFGTIGGGQLEFHAIDVARAMLAEGTRERRIDLPLGPHLGQCCGGRVTLTLERAEARHLAPLAAEEESAAAARPRVLVLGAGHTGRALAQALAPLPFETILVDDREGVFGDLPETIRTLRLDDPGEAVAAAPPGSAYVVLTHSHALDYRLADMALKRGDAAYVGMIGSATKRARFEHSFKAQGGAPAALAGFVCPIGGSAVRDKRPEVIAALTAAELVQRLLPGSGEFRSPAR